MHRRVWLLLGLVLSGALLTALPPYRPAVPGRVRPGIDVLLSDSARLIAGKRLGLITNQAGVDAAGVATIDRLARWPGARLLALFAPEHGIRGTGRPGEPVRDSVDAASGLPIYSLYGASRAPSPAQLARLDVLLVDLQDVGARPFTFVSTMVLAMRAAAAARKRVVVLDRPNPIGCAVAGPVLDTAFASFIGMLPVPLRHGMTIGELARFANAELGIGADLLVVPVQGWRRCQWFDETGLPWVAPSPNLPELESVAWYPGTVLLEATNLSVGRGTEAPFRAIGAPWLDAAAVARLLRSRIPAVIDTAVSTPRAPGDGKYDGVPVRAIRFPRYARRPRPGVECAPPGDTLPRRYSHSCESDPVGSALALFEAVRTVHPESLRVDWVGLSRRLGVPVSGRGSWLPEFSRFISRRQRHLLYR